MEKNRKSKKNGKLKGFLVMLITIIGSAAVGIFIADTIFALLGDNMGFAEYFVWLCLYLLVLYAAHFLQIIIHESGHLVFGILTGYKFSSFRIGNAILTKDGEKFRIGYYSLAGTAGQCLLYLPEENEKIPYVLYNLGGVIMNVIFSGVSFALWLAFPDIPVISVALVCLFATGLMIALTNGVPMSVGMVNNDGLNALSLGKDPHALRSFANQLRVNARMAKGERLRDMPCELFELTDDADAGNTINAAIRVFACNRLMDEHRFSEAAELCKILIADKAVLPIYKNMLVCDLAFCEMVSGERERAASRFNKELEKFLSLMSKNPGIIRTRYAHALACEKDMRKAEKHLESFEKLAKKYPYSGDIESERELLAEIRTAVNL
jgi:hypothetical protein